MSLTLGRFTRLCFESPDLAGTATATAPPEDASSLSDHEAAFSPDAQRAPAADPDDEPAESDRRSDGTFKPRHRAASQRADADDVPAISEHTRRIKDAEARLGADIVRKDGESERVYTLRRRAELLERQSHTPPATATAPTSTEPPVAVRRPTPQAIPQAFPAYDAFIAIQGNEDKTYEDYVDARADWRYAIRRESERQSEAAETQQRTQAEQIARFNAGVTTARAKYADWDRVVTADAAITPTLQFAILASEHSAEIAYYLGQHPDERAALNADTTDYSPAAVAPLRRYLDSLVAGQRSPIVSPSRAAAAPTGSALASVPPVAPKPPNPVRTGSIATPETPPGDDSMSISDHEKHYGARRR